MDFKSLLIGFLLAVVLVLASGSGGNKFGWYQVGQEKAFSRDIIVSQNETATLIDIGGWEVETYNF